MHAHHAETIEKVIAHFRADPTVQALLLTGSIAHGFESASSDVDIAIVISEESYAARIRPAPSTREAEDDAHGGSSRGPDEPPPPPGPPGASTFFDKDMAAYEGGYVDGKYTTLSFIRDVAARGSEPARFAFAGACILFCRPDADADTGPQQPDASDADTTVATPAASSTTSTFRADLEAALHAAASYPTALRRDRMVRFRAQLEAWRWYSGEALRHGNVYLLRVAVGRLVLFGGRLVLAHNAVLYPYHKWFLRVLADVPEKPDGMMEAIERVEAEPTLENVEAFYALVKGWRAWEESPRGWGAQFMVDSELNWMTGSTPVDDL